jgi:hypothetical protein
MLIVATLLLGIEVVMGGPKAPNPGGSKVTFGGYLWGIKELYIKYTTLCCAILEGKVLKPVNRFWGHVEGTGLQGHAFRATIKGRLSFHVKVLCMKI